MKKLPIILLLLSIVVYSQKKKSSKMGQTTLDEIQMTVYDKDSTAAAVVLYEHANVYLDEENDNKTRIDYYYRIKIINKEAFDKANISINLYKEKRILKIKGITYNTSEIGSMNRTYLSEDMIFKIKENEDWTSHKFTLPNIKEGSVIEYSYSIISPYLGIPDWYFQSDIPKVKSEFDAAFLGNYRYNIALLGFKKLDRNENSIKKSCVYIQGLGEGDCAIYGFGMNDVPAFKEEDYMLSKKNYLSRISFDLKTFTTPRGVVNNYTTTWKEADKKLRKLFFNSQTSKKGFFKKNIPESILLTENKLDRAKKVYSFIQNHYNWNEKYWNNKDEKVKQAFENKVGTTGEINLSLYNALEAAEIKTDLVILSTRKNGIPKSLYPVIFDFNYVIVKVQIDEKDYFLDATDKLLPFGQVPFRTLNGKARIINYKKESNWVKLTPKFKSSRTISAKLTLDENGDVAGNLLIRRQGYFAQYQREKLATIGEDGYIEEFEEVNPDVEIDDYKVSYEDELEKTLQEVFKVNILLGDEDAQKIRINPFFFDRLEENPFKLKERNYPVDFGYSKRSNFALNFKIPDNYTVTSLPKKVAISLPNKGGSFVLKAVSKDNIINLYCRLQINRSIFSAEEYYNLKEFYKQIVIAENSYITLEKND